jgi:predicted hydrocarbon binding protein
MEAAQDTYFWPNKMGRMYLLALEDVMGKNGVRALLNEASLQFRMHNLPPDNLDLGWSFEESSAINQALIEMHGSSGAKGLATRAGRAWFHHVLKDLSAVLGIGDVAFRLLPSAMKIKLGLGALAETFGRTSDQVVRVEEEEGRLFYHIERCPTCWHRTAEEPICYTDLGLLEEFLLKVARGKGYRVKESYCIAKGDPACTFVIDRYPQG